MIITSTKKNTHYNHLINNSAFTLIELAIVIVIIGLITGGVLGAQSLIKSAQINSQVQQINNFKTAVSAFELEYDTIPGDLTDAYDYWGTDCGTSSTEATAGCNGYGNKCINYSSTSCNENYHYYGDTKRFAVHLAFSEIMPNINWIRTTSGNTDCSGSSGGTFISSKLDDGIIFPSSNETPNKVYLYFHNSANYTHSGTLCTSATFNSTSYVTNGKTLKSIDKKLDDGNGRAGKIQARTYPSNDQLVTACTNSDGSYIVNTTDKNCSFRAEIK